METSQDLMQLRQMRPKFGDHLLNVTFFTDAVLSEVDSDAEGHPVFKDFEMIEIRVPSDPTVILRTFVTPEYTGRFPGEYKNFKNKTKTATVGTPLEEWPAVTKSQVETFKFNSVFSVEDLAGLSDDAVLKYMGGQSLRAKAQAYLSAAKDTALVQKQASEIEDLRKKLEALEKKTTK